MMNQAGPWNTAYRRIIPQPCPHCSNGHKTSLLRLERAQAAISRAQIADNQRETLARNHALMECRRMLVELQRDVEPEQPFSEVLETVFTVGVQRVEAALRNYEHHAIELVQRDLDDLLAGFRLR